MWILALDASLARCSAAVLADGVLRAHRGVDTDRGHAALLPRMVSEVLEEAGIRAPELDAVAAVIGPGGFTGLRTALALAEGLALAAAVPTIGVTTGEALAVAVPPAFRAGGRAVWTVVDTRRGRVVLERFAAGAAEPEAPPEALAEEELPMPTGPLAIAGDAAAAVVARLLARGADAIDSGIRCPDATDAARVAALRLTGRLGPRTARPLYAEPPAVRLPAAGGRAADAP